MKTEKGWSVPEFEFSFHVCPSYLDALCYTSCIEQAHWLFISLSTATFANSQIMWLAALNDCEGHMRLTSLRLYPIARLLYCVWLAESAPYITHRFVTLFTRAHIFIQMNPDRVQSSFVVGVLHRKAEVKNTTWFHHVRLPVFDLNKWFTSTTRDWL